MLTAESYPFNREALGLSRAAQAIKKHFDHEHFSEQVVSYSDCG